MNMELLSKIVAATFATGFIVLHKSEAGLMELVQAGHAECNDAAPGVQDGQTGVRATNQGIQFSQSQAQGGFGQPQGGFGNVQADQGATTSQASGSQTVQTNGNGSAPVFVRVNDFAPPANATAPKKREQPEKYPFGDLKAPVANPNKASGFDYDAIFVPSSKYGPKHEKAGQLRSPDDMAFSLLSACSAAERRYATVTGTKTNAKGKQSNVYNKEREFKAVGGMGPNNEPGAYIYRAK